MASNSFGRHFRITTWGESHGPAIGVLIDGCPAGLPFSEEMLVADLDRRKPGVADYTSPRKEPDRARILSGLFDGVTTGAPLFIMIDNRDADSTAYEAIKDVARPGHANSSWLKKYGVFDWRGGGRASARETASRVAAGAVAKAFLAADGIEVRAQLLEVGGLRTGWEAALQQAMDAGDSLGGIVGFAIDGLPAGLGDPVYDKFEAHLAFAMMSIPAVKGFEVGEGFHAAAMHASDHNDQFSEEGPLTNHAGGILGGVTTGSSVYGRCAFKPPSSIKKEQATVSLTTGKSTTFRLPEGSRHDPCVAIRGVAVVEAMAALVTADALLANRLVKIGG